MRYLLVGNGPIRSLTKAAEHSDIIVQINDCRHCNEINVERDSYIFLTNTGGPTNRLVDKLESGRASLLHARIILARNPAFYTVKKWFMRAKRDSNWGDYEVSTAWQSLRGLWPIESVSCLSALRLEYKLRALGMREGCMPSTGLIAYDWLLHRLQPGDSIDLDGFTFQGWWRHPWEIESQLIRTVGISPVTEETKRAITA